MEGTEHESSVSSEGHGEDGPSVPQHDDQAYNTIVKERIWINKLCFSFASRTLALRCTTRLHINFTSLLSLTEYGHLANFLST